MADVVKIIPGEGENRSNKIRAPSVRRRSTLVRRVSDMFKDGNYSGPPLLFRNTSMQKIRHCCQNLNLFPYLLYSLENSKSHPLAKKVNLYIGLLLKYFTEHISRLNVSLQRTICQRLRFTKDSLKVTNEKIDDAVREEKIVAFERFEKRKKKQISPVLKLAVYFALFVLAFQLVGLCSLMIFGKYIPGFLFLIIALLFLGYILLKIMIHDKDSRPRQLGKRKRKSSQ